MKTARQIRHELIDVRHSLLDAQKTLAPGFEATRHVAYALGLVERCLGPVPVQPVEERRTAVTPCLKCGKACEVLVPRVIRCRECNEDKATTLAG